MNKLYTLIAVAGILPFVACGPSVVEIQRANFVKDSISQLRASNSVKSVVEFNNYLDSIAREEKSDLYKDNFTIGETPVILGAIIKKVNNEVNINIILRQIDGNGKLLEVKHN